MIIGINFYVQDQMPMAIYFGLTAAACGLFYPNYFHWRYKKHYSNFIKENYQNRFGAIEQIEITPEFIFSKDKTGEGKLKVEEIDEVSETKNHFMLKISTGMSLIIPKRELENIDRVRIELNAIGLKVIDELNWEWK